MPAIRWIAVVCFAAALPSAVRAADPAQATPEQKAQEEQIPEMEVEEMVIVAPARLEPSPPPAGDPSVTVLDSKEIDGAHARSVQELLQQIPASSLSDEQGNPFQQDLMLRGFVAGPVTGLPQGLSVFVDGVRVNEPAVEEVNFDLVPLEDVERIEVIRGPNVVFGRNTLGGAINIVTKRGGTKGEAEIDLQAGSWAYQQVRARASGPLGPLDGYLSVTELTESGWRPVGASRGIRAFGKIGLKRPDTDLTLSYQFADNRLEEPGSLPASFLAVDRRQNYTRGDFFQPTLHLVTLNGTQRLSPGLSLSANGFFRALNPEQFNASFVSADTRLFNSTSSGGGTLQFDYRLNLGTLRSQTTIGGELTYTSVHIRVNEEANAQVTTTDDGDPLPAVAADLADTQHSGGAFLQQQIRFGEGPLAGLSATGALRYDRISHDILDTSPATPGQASGQVAFERWSPAFGLSYAFGPRWVASASYAAGFRAPAFLELTCADPAAPCIGLQAGVAPDATFTALRPVRSQAYEASISVLPVEGSAVAVNLFRVDLHDDILSINPTGTTSVVFQNVGETRRQGIELSARLQRAIFAIRGAYSYTLATFENDVELATPRLDTGVERVRKGSQIPLVPNHRVDLDGSVRALPWLTLTAGVRYVGSQYLRGDEENVTSKLGGYLVARAGIEARWRGWTASLRATNLFNSQYETFGTYAPNGKVEGSPIEPFLTPGLPFHLVGGLRWELD